MSSHILEIISLDAGDRVGNKIGHYAVDRAAIIPALVHDGLERGDVGRIAEQLGARFEIIINARTRARKIIGFIHAFHLMKPAPIVPRRERINGMKKRIVVGSANSSGRQRKKKNSGSTDEPVDFHDG